MTYALFVTFTATGMPITWNRYNDSDQAYRDGKALLKSGGIHAYTVCKLGTTHC